MRPLRIEIAPVKLGLLGVVVLLLSSRFRRPSNCASPQTRGSLCLPQRQHRGLEDRGQPTRHGSIVLQLRGIVTALTVLPSGLRCSAGWFARLWVLAVSAVLSRDVVVRTLLPTAIDVKPPGRDQFATRRHAAVEQTSPAVEPNFQIGSESYVRARQRNASSVLAT